MPASRHSWSAVQCPHCSGQMKVGECEAAPQVPAGESQPYIRVTEEEEARARAERKYQRLTRVMMLAGIAGLTVAVVAVVWVAISGALNSGGKESGAPAPSAENQAPQAQWPVAPVLVERFLTAPQWRDMLPLVADASRVEGVMAWYYSRHPHNPPAGPVKLLDFQKDEAAGRRLLRIQAEVAGRLPFWLLFIEENREWKVDWEVFVNAHGERWAAFLREPAGTLVELPFHIAKKPAATGYLVKAGVTPDTHEAVVLWVMERQSLAAAVLAKSAAEWRDLPQIGYDDAVKVIARVKMENPAADPPLVRLEKIVQSGWVRGQ